MGKEETKCKDWENDSGRRRGERLKDNKKKEEEKKGVKLIRKLNIRNGVARAEQQRTKQNSGRTTVGDEEELERIERGKETRGRERQGEILIREN